MFRRKPKIREFRPTCRYISEAVTQALTDEEVRDALCRHQRGDWGSVDRHIRRWNDRNLAMGNGELMSIFKTKDGIRFTVCTNSSQTFTAVKLIHEY